MRMFIAFILLLVFVPAPAFPAVANGIWEKLAGGTGTSLSGDIVISSGSNRVAYVSVVFEHATATISSPALEGVAMTSIEKISDGTGVSVEVFRLIAPATNAAASFTGTLSTSTNWHVVGVEFTGLNQTTPNGTPAEAAALTTGPITVNVASVNAGERVVDFVGAGSEGTVFTVGTGQTEAQQNGNHNVRSGGSYEDSTGTVTMSWTTSQIDSWVTIAFALKPAAVPSQFYRRRRQ